MHLPTDKWISARNRGLDWIEIMSRKGEKVKEKEICT